MKLRVCSDALVMPSSTGLAVAGTLARLLQRRVPLVELDPVELLALQEVGLAGVLDLHLLQHLPHDDLDVLVIDGHALQPVDVLDLVDQVVGELLDALDREDVVRRGVAVVDEVTLLDAVAVLHGKALAARNQILLGLGVLIVRLDGDALLVLVVLAELHRAGDLRDDGVVLRTARLEQLRHARQTARDVAGLGAGERDARQHVAGLHLGMRLHRQDGIHRQQIARVDAARHPHRLAALRFLDDDRGLQVGPRGVARQSTITRLVVPFISSVCSFTETPSTRSAKSATPSTSVRIGRM